MYPRLGDDDVVIGGTGGEVGGEGVEEVGGCLEVDLVLVLVLGEDAGGEVSWLM